MPRDVKADADYDKELAQLDVLISSNKKELLQLTAKRRELLSKKQHMDMDVVLEHIIELGFTANEVLGLLDSAAKIRQ